ncbi:MAG: hypothetical protein KKF46_06425 [Nanoarchaeota archaeon]|nr:hypothetical protein [Nanoarchaeota archaeon]MBU1321964.1 hypothetical protein [Nanoarchaeota archaeon]MBU1597458.1 hypothetical protein [Nanoarchaeota archaeon]MBU2442377.1 hypothetical protein [Nanoarchaeota archaeon]
MVDTSDNLSAEEKIKQLVGFEQEKSKELKEKRKELEEKQKELEELEKQGKSEIENARAEIEEKIEELAIEEKKRFEELEALRRRREQEASLEETIAKESQDGEREAFVQKGYTAVFEEILEGRPGFYEVTNYNVVNRLEQIAQEAKDRSLTNEEQKFVDRIQYHAERMRGTEFYQQKDNSNYLSRELQQIDNINKSIRERDKPKDYAP